MPSNSPDFAQSVVVLAGTYLLHSTVLLAGAWLLVKVGRVRSHVLAERLWKMAAVLGLVTVPLQVVLGWSSPIFDVTLRYGESTRDSANGAGNRVFDDSLHPVPAARTEGVDAQLSNAASPNPDVVDAIELTDGVYRSRDEYRGNTQDVVSGVRRHLNDGGSNNRPASLARSKREELGRIQRSPQPPQKGRHLSTAAVRPCRSGAVVSPPVTEGFVFGGATLTAGFVLCGLSVLLVQTCLLYRRCAGSRKVGDGTARRTLDRLLQENSIWRQVRLLSSDVFHEPIAFGLARWTIVLPSGIEQRLGKDELKALLAHELAHLVRGDVFWLWAGRVLCSCLAFQPLNFLARRRWQRAAEFLCDDWAVGRGGDAISLARCLTRIAEWRLVERECAAGLSAGGSKGGIVMRVERLVRATGQTDIWTSPSRRGLLQVAAVVAAACLVCVAPRVVLRAYATGLQNRDCSPNDGELKPALPRERAATRVVQWAEEWRLLEEELFELDRDLSYAIQLVRRISGKPEVDDYAEQLRRHVLVLQDRRHVLAEQTKKELGR